MGWLVYLSVSLVTVVLALVVASTRRHPFRRHRWEIVRTQNEVGPDFYGGDTDDTYVWEVCTRRQCRGVTTRVRHIEGYWTKDELKGSLS